MDDRRGTYFKNISYSTSLEMKIEEEYEKQADTKITVKQDDAISYKGIRNAIDEEIIDFEFNRQEERKDGDTDITLVTNFASVIKVGLNFKNNKIN
jgi:hypothetical protein